MRSWVLLLFYRLICNTHYMVSPRQLSKLVALRIIYLGVHSTSLLHLTIYADMSALSLHNRELSSTILEVGVILLRAYIPINKENTLERQLLLKEYKIKILQSCFSLSSPHKTFLLVWSVCEIPALWLDAILDYAGAMYQCNRDQPCILTHWAVWGSSVLQLYIAAHFRALC